MTTKKFIVSGGGTGGHIFPAISIAGSLQKRFPDSEILFVGALGKMEMERVPAAGYKIEGLPVSGFDRRNMLRNIKVLINLIISNIKAKQIIRRFKPDAVIGVGGYASYPTLRAAAGAGIPTLIQEQNSYAGMSNISLAKKAKKICVAYDGMEKFFPVAKIVKTGNPVRNLKINKENIAQAYAHFNLNPVKKTLLITGGSLGARTINSSIAAGLEQLTGHDNIQIIWQTGKLYINDVKRQMEKTAGGKSQIIVMEFIARMDYAYALADLVISRAGACSISELCLVAKPAILVPSPNVTEDHQTKNAMALVNSNAAILVKDAEAPEKLVSTALELIKNDLKLSELSKNIEKLAEKNSADRIVDEIVLLL
jgi:UDP-N-acetylglucosamine--N-acetylmuramyl-(pentapeptide) pyrophosphoryl-undecaprenol N-acetylglucosamine transferase